tara:strand:- start:164 stop:424 length:261 start_codon:yes stop_codon:yes gene_type:complete
MIKLTIADATGHTELMIEVDDVLSHLPEGGWIFADGRLVNADFDFNEAEEVAIMPQLVGGIHNKCLCNRPISKNADLCFVCKTNIK